MCRPKRAVKTADCASCAGGLRAGRDAAGSGKLGRAEPQAAHSRESGGNSPARAAANAVEEPRSSRVGDWACQCRDAQKAVVAAGHTARPLGTAGLAAGASAQKHAMPAGHSFQGAITSRNSNVSRGTFETHCVFHTCAVFSIFSAGTYRSVVCRNGCEPNVPTS